MCTNLAGLAPVSGPANVLGSHCQKCRHQPPIALEAFAAAADTSTWAATGSTVSHLKNSLQCQHGTAYLGSHVEMPSDASV